MQINTLRALHLPTSIPRRPLGKPWRRHTCRKSWWRRVKVGWWGTARRPGGQPRGQWRKQRSLRRGSWLSSITRRSIRRAGNAARSGRSLRGGCLEEVGWQGLHGGGHAVGLCLFREQTLCVVTVAGALAVLLVGVLHRDLLAHHVLAVHVRDGGVRGVEVGVGHEAVALGHVELVAGDLGGADELAEAQEGVVEGTLVDHGVQVANEQFGADLHALSLVCRCLVHADCRVEETRAVEDGDDIIGVVFGCELDEAEALVLAVDAVDGHVDGAHAAVVVHELGEELLGDIFVNVTDVDGRLLVLLPGVELAVRLGYAGGTVQCSPVTRGRACHGGIARGRSDGIAERMHVIRLEHCPEEMSAVACVGCCRRR